MSNHLSQFLAQARAISVTNKAPGRQLLKSVGGGTGAITNGQLVYPSLSWDWPVVTVNTISESQYNFSDTIPKQVQAEVIYESSADSFSSNYRMFLDTINEESFPYPKALTDARKLMTAPDPEATSAPEGWTHVSVAGILRWRPIWTLSTSSYDWQNQVKTGAVDNPGSIEIDLTETPTGVLDAASDVNVNTGLLKHLNESFTTVTMTAKAWGQIVVHPGAWYQASMLKMGRDHLPNPDDFFGPSGLLRGRVSTFIVAQDVTFSFSSNEKLTKDDKPTMSNADSLRVLGIPSKLSTAIPANDHAMQMKADSQLPIIVAAIVESLS